MKLRPAVRIGHGGRVRATPLHIYDTPSLADYGYHPLIVKHLECALFRFSHHQTLITRRNGGSSPAPVRVESGSALRSVHLGERIRVRLDLGPTDGKAATPSRHVEQLLSRCVLHGPPTPVWPPARIQPELDEALLPEQGPGFLGT